MVGASVGTAPKRRRTRSIVLGLALIGATTLPAVAAQAHDTGAKDLPVVDLLLDETPAASAAKSHIGHFSSPFSEPKIDGKRTGQKCIRDSKPPDELVGKINEAIDNSAKFRCKPAGVSVNVLPNGGLMYYDGLEGTENVKYSIVSEYGYNAVNDQARQLELGGGATGKRAKFAPTTPGDGGANANGDPTSEKSLPPALIVAQQYNAGALFCSDNTFLPDGRVLANGGTDYYLEPGVKVGDAAYGVSELEGIKQSRIYDPSSNSWAQTGTMHYGRWYPTSLALGDGDVFTASGVTKLLKPVYPDHPLDSGTNVKQTEIYDLQSGKWKLNPASANKSLPLFPRLALLPDGKVFYNTAGQSFNPFGQSYDEALWNEASVYDPKAQSWQDLGIPGLTDLSSGMSVKPEDAVKDITTNAIDSIRQTGIPGFGASATIPGFRGSTFSMMLPLKPGAHHGYSKASFLTAGGVLNPGSPGSYLSTSDSRITTVDTKGGADKMSTRPTGDLPGPRWYPSGVSLPTGQVIAFNGSDRDEVVGPGVEIAKRQAEMFDPKTEKWSPLAFSHEPRTYHNSAALLPDGRILIGGHAPISTLYLNDTTLPGGITAPNDGRDPSFEIYSPPYLFWGKRPRIRQAPSRLGYGKKFTVRTKRSAKRIKSVVLSRNTSVTHLVDGNQRTVKLRVLSRHGHKLRVRMPSNHNVTPPGPYMLFVNRSSKKGLIPSKSAQTYVGLGGLYKKAR